MKKFIILYCVAILLLVRITVGDLQGPQVTNNEAKDIPDSSTKTSSKEENHAEVNEEDSTESADSEHVISLDKFITAVQKTKMFGDSVQTIEERDGKKMLLQLAIFERLKGEELIVRKKLLEQMIKMESKRREKVEPIDPTQEEIEGKFFQNIDTKLCIHNYSFLLIWRKLKVCTKRPWKY